MATLLSTKKLTAAQQQLVLNAGIGLVSYNAIQIELLEVKTPVDVIANVIFTSKNAVKAILATEVEITNCFCVGQNTKNVLEENGFSVLETANNATDLATLIADKYKESSFTFFCGNLRRDELPNILTQKGVDYNEIIVYHTTYQEQYYDRTFDGILFFSPSAIQSYLQSNKTLASIALCIGNTTASEARKHTENVIVASKTTIENVLVTAIKYFKEKDNS